jgi:hypothetical protein
LCCLSWVGNRTRLECKRDLLHDYCPRSLNTTTRRRRRRTRIPCKCYRDTQRLSNYLLGETSSSGRSKLDKLLDHLRSLSETYEGFRIRVTCHSLGGALATLFTCEEWMPPIKCVSFASPPRVGNIEFLRAFRRLEEKGRIEKLRVVNESDVVTSLPDRLNCCTAFLQRSIYRHVWAQNSDSFRI